MLVCFSVPISSRFYIEHTVKHTCKLALDFCDYVNSPACLLILRSYIILLSGVRESGTRVLVAVVGAATSQRELSCPRFLEGPLLPSPELPQ